MWFTLGFISGIIFAKLVTWAYGCVKKKPPASTAELLLFYGGFVAAFGKDSKDMIVRWQNYVFSEDYFFANSSKNFIKNYFGSMENARAIVNRWDELEKLLRELE